jgi:PhnB protein
MARVSTYLNFMGNTEEAFTFYKTVFGTEFLGDIQRMGDVPSNPGVPPLSEAEQHMVMHMELPILGGHILMGTDMIESMGHHLRIGNNTTLMLEPDDRAEADRLFDLLSEGGTESAGMMEMFWGAYWGVCLDRFGIRWMINVDAS